jgi:hypothetical protein
MRLGSFTSIWEVTCTFGAGAARGGLGGGGGGATMRGAITWVGNAAGCNSGQTMTANKTATLRAKVTRDQYLLFDLIRFADSISESSNMSGLD